eukprot:scaffold503_cov242-Isochrysis_galbana.AAC.3
MCSFTALGLVSNAIRARAGAAAGAARCCLSLRTCNRCVRHRGSPLAFARPHRRGIHLSGRRRRATATPASENAGGGWPLPRGDDLMAVAAAESAADAGAAICWAFALPFAFCPPRESFKYCVHNTGLKTERQVVVLVLASVSIERPRATD